MDGMGWDGMGWFVIALASFGFVLVALFWTVVTDFWPL